MQHQTFAPETPEQIENRLDDDRKALSSALSALGAKFTPDALWAGGLSLIKSNSGPYTRAVDHAIRGNPMAVALTAVGLAWLILGRRQHGAGNGIPLPGTHVEAVARWEDEGGPVTETLTETPGTDDVWLQDADRLRRKANALISQIDGALRKKNAPAAELFRHRNDVIVSLAKDVRRVMARGMEHLTDDARRLALTGRERSYEAHVQKPASFKAASRDTPLAMGAAYAVAGATLGVLLPRSSVENQAMGAPRDQLVDTVRHALRDERQLLAQSVQRIAQSLLADPVAAPSNDTSNADRF